MYHCVLEFLTKILKELFSGNVEWKQQVSAATCSCILTSLITVQQVISHRWALWRIPQMRLVLKPEEQHVVTFITATCILARRVLLRTPKTPPQIRSDHWKYRKEKTVGCNCVCFNLCNPPTCERFVSNLWKSNCLTLQALRARLTNCIVC